MSYLHPVLCKGETIFHLNWLCMDASIYAQNLDICILPMSDNLCRKYIFTFELSRCPKPLLDQDQINATQTVFSTVFRNHKMFWQFRYIFLWKGELDTYRPSNGPDGWERLEYLSESTVHYRVHYGGRYGVNYEVHYWLHYRMHSKAFEHLK